MGPGRSSLVQPLALALLRGHVLDLEDEHGRRWRATSRSLSLVLPGSGAEGPVLEDVSAYDVAALLVAAVPSAVVSDLREHLLLVERLRAELQRLGMAKHLEKLALYAAGIGRAGRPGEGGWTREHVEDLAKMLRVPPFADAYPVRPRMSTCTCASPTTYTRASWPGGSLHACGRCHDVWIELAG